MSESNQLAVIEESKAESMGKLVIDYWVAV